MIRKIYIENFILIDQKEICFEEGLNVLTGETGHGKSILLRAIILLFKGTISKKFIRDPNKFTKIKGEISSGDKNYIIERIFNKTKSIIKVNDKEITLNELEKITSPILTSFTQFQKLEILSQNNQLKFIDSLMKKKSSLIKYEKEYSKYHNLKSQLKKTKDKFEELEKFISFYKEELLELESYDLKEEDLTLEKNIEEFNNFEFLVNRIHELELLLNDEQSGITNNLLQIKKIVNQLDKESLSSSLYDLTNSINLFENSLLKELSKINQVQESHEEYLSRLEELKPILKKNNNSVERLFEKYNNVKSKIEEYSQLKEEVSLLEIKLKDIESLALASAKKLSKDRKSFCKKIIKNTESSLKELKLKDCSLKISFEDKPLSEDGIDSVSIMARTNIGSDFYPLEDISSGGELSRILFTLLTQESNHNILCFDEIDSGVGGKTIIAFCKKLKKLAQDNQIICISHNPAIAIIADNNINVTKSNKENSTISSFSNLNSLETIKEISRMLGYGESKREISITRNYIKELIHQIEG